MGFRARIARIKDPEAPIAKRVMALCDALTHCHAGYAKGKAELRQRFGWEIGDPVKVTEKVDRLTVFGGLEGVLQETVRINV